MRQNRGRKTWKSAVFLFLLLVGGVFLLSRPYFSDPKRVGKDGLRQEAGPQQEKDAPQREADVSQWQTDVTQQATDATQLVTDMRQKASAGGHNRFGQYSAAAAFFIWKQFYPVYFETGKDAGPEVSGASGEGTGWLLKFVMRQVPYYRMMKEQGAPEDRGEIDPAYRDYVESHRILEEYEYLVRGLSGSAVMSSGSNPLSGGASAYLSGGGQAGAAGQSGGGAAGQNGTGAAGQNAAGQGGTGQNAPSAEYASGGNERGTGGNMAGTEILDHNGIAAAGTRYIEEQLADYDFLMKHFYTVHPTTTAGRDMMKAETFLSQDFSLEEGNGGPQILIYHTHSQEEFADYGSNKEATIMGVGMYLTELLEKKGYSVIHDTSVYDLKNGKLDRSKAYTYALDGITGILQKYPSIQVVLDIHRDGVKAGTHLVQEVNGKQTATIMFFNGTSQTPTGPIEYLKNPYRTENMAFSFQMKLCADACYPGFTRKIYLKGLRYNMHLRPRSALIEVGAQTNTYEEARNAMEPLAELLDMVLRKNNN